MPIIEAPGDGERALLRVAEWIRCRAGDLASAAIRRGWW